MGALSLIKNNDVKIIVVLLFITSLFIPLTSGWNDHIDSIQIEDIFEKTSTISDGGLIDSAWPMFHHDTQHTGRSPYGPIGNFPVVKWRFLMEGMTISSPAIDENSIIYIGSDGFHDKFFFAINSNGSEKWHFNPGDWVISSPAFSSDGTIYFGSLNGNLNALHPNGTTKWIIHIGAGWVFSSPVIGNDGTIYVASVNSNRLCAVNPNGTMKWYFDADFLVYSSPAIDDNGVIYFGSHDTYLYALYPNGTLKWRYKTNDRIKGSPSIGDDGTIYVCSWDNNLYAIAPNGTLKWRFGAGSSTETSPAIASDGTIYIGSYNGQIFSIAPTGVENWHYQTGGEIYSSPAIDTYGIIYCGSYDGNLYALNPNGTLRWRFAAGEYIESSPVIGADGTIYIAAQFEPSGGNSSYTSLYALQLLNSQPPSTPTIDGPSSGKIGHTYSYTVISTDPDRDNISYYVDWGDGSNTGWLGPYNSGVEQTVSHTWGIKGTYTIQVKAKDTHGVESGWGTLQVTMPMNSNMIGSPFLRLLELFFDRHSYVFPVLRSFFDQ
jgi:outer membrane protein assembly factor BamB